MILRNLIHMFRQKSARKLTCMSIYVTYLVQQICNEILLLKILLQKLQILNTLIFFQFKFTYSAIKIRIFKSKTNPHDLVWVYLCVFTCKNATDFPQWKICSISVLCKHTQCKISNTLYGCVAFYVN